MDTAPDLSIAEAAERVRRGATSPGELLETCLARAEAWEPIVRAFVVLDAEGARRQARALSRVEDRGPLYGIPLAVKDVIDVAGLPTRAGSRVLEGIPASRDAWAVRRLREAGAVILGKTTTHEFAHGVETPPTRNPWDPTRIPGGSSGGSAAAVAVGACLGALGTDSGGSIRVPAALCGVSGLRPRQGMVPLEGVLPMSPSHDVCGPLARSVADLALLWEALTGSLHVFPDLRGLRVAVPRESDVMPLVDGEVGSAFVDAAQVFRAAGSSLTEVALPPFPAWEEPRTLVVLAEFLAVHRRAGWYPARADRYGEEVLAYLRRAESVPPDRLAAARARLVELSEAFLRALEDADLLLLPTVPVPAPPAGGPGGSAPGTLRRPIVATLIRFCAPIGWCGLAAVSAPCGLVAGSLPVGLQIVGRNEVSVLAAGMAFERMAGLPREGPPGSGPRGPDGPGVRGEGRRTGAPPDP